MLLTIQGRLQHDTVIQGAYHALDAVRILKNDVTLIHVIPTLFLVIQMIQPRAVSRQMYGRITPPLLAVKLHKASMQGGQTPPGRQSTD